MPWWHGYYRTIFGFDFYYLGGPLIWKSTGREAPNPEENSQDEVEEEEVEEVEEEELEEDSPPRFVLIGTVKGGGFDCT